MQVKYDSSGRVSLAHKAQPWTRRRLLKWNASRVRPNVHHAPNSRGPLQTMMVQRNATSLRRNATEDTAKAGRNQRRHRRHAPRPRLTGGGGVVMAAAPWILQNGIIQAPKK